jgi:hypothetical protein
LSIASAASWRHLAPSWQALSQQVEAYTFWALPAQKTFNLTTKTTSDLHHQNPTITYVIRPNHTIGKLKELPII